jgi:hypothetical protein
MKHIADMARTDNIAFEGDIKGHKVIVDVIKNRVEAIWGRVRKD